MHEHFSHSFKIESPLNILDLGAAFGGKISYAPIIKDYLCQVYGIDARDKDDVSALNFHEFLKGLNDQTSYEHHQACLGDGKLRDFYVPEQRFLSSLLKPDLSMLEQLTGYACKADLVEVLSLQTQKLDVFLKEIQTHQNGISSPDFIKADLQGAEHMVFTHGGETLKSALAVHLEVFFYPIYYDQPLFAEIDLLMRSYGFQLYKFDKAYTRTHAPYTIKGHYPKQWVRTDAIYFKKQALWADVSNDQLFKLAGMMHSNYQAYDLSLKILDFLVERAQERKDLSGLANIKEVLASYKSALLAHGLRVKLS